MEITIEKTVVQRAKEVRENTWWVLENHAETRNDDRLLMLKYWAEFDGALYDETFPVTFATQCTSPESITRARRYIQNKMKMFLPTTEIAQDRRSRQGDLRDYYANLKK